MSIEMFIRSTETRSKILSARGNPNVNMRQERGPADVVFCDSAPRRFRDKTSKKCTVLSITKM